MFPFPSLPAATRLPVRGLPRLAVLLLLGLAGVLAEARPVQGQTPGREPAAVELAPGARALGLGWTPQLGSDDPDLAFVHPALVQSLSGVQAGYIRLGESGSGYSAAAAADWFGGGVAISVHTLEYVGPAGGPGTRADGLDDLVSSPVGGRGVSESAATLTYGRTLRGVQVGVSARAYTQRIGDDRFTGGAADLGIARGVGPLRLALSARNLGGDADLPEEVVLGAGAYGQPLGPLDVGAAAQLRYRDDGELVVGGGLEVGYWPVRGRTFVGRVGLRNVPEGNASPVTVGGSFWGDSLVLDYAYQPVDGRDGIHRLGVGWR